MSATKAHVSADRRAAARPDILAAFRLTVFQDRFARTKSEKLIDLPGLRVSVCTTTAHTKGKLPLLKLATFGDRRTIKDSLRHNANMLTICGLEADYDSERVSFEDACTILSEAGVRALGYTSPSHTEDKPRWRVLCPFSKEYPPNRRDAFMGRLNGLFGGIFSSESWTLSQSFYLGSVNNNPAHRAEIIEGTSIDLLEALDETWIGRPGATTGTANEQGNARPVGSSGTFVPTSSARLESYRNSVLDTLRRGAVDGQKHVRLRAAARTLGGIQVQAGFTDADATQWLMDALPDTVEDWILAASTAAWALAKGREQPITLEVRPRDHRKPNGATASGNGDGRSASDNVRCGDEPYANGHPAPAASAEAINAEAVLAQLAKLPMVQYAQRRGPSAKALGFPVGMLDKLVVLERGGSQKDAQGEALEFPDPEAWAYPVDGFELICDIRDLLHRHIVLPAGAGWAIALWCLHTFLLGITEHTPRLAVISPERGCGKTTLFDLLGRLVFRALLAANLTPAATFRVIARHRPSLLIDEADTFLRNNDELRGVLNAGHRYDGFVLRVVGEDMEPRRFSVFSAVAIALIGNLPGTLADRSIAVRMRRAGTADTVEPIRKPTHTVAVEIVRRAHRWAKDHHDKLTEAEPRLPSSMWNRVADNWRPLFAIAEAIGGDMPMKLTEAATTLLAQGAADPQSLGIMLLQDIREVFRAKDDRCDRMSSADLVRDLVAMDERPWLAFGKTDKSITPVRMAEILRQFAILSGTKRVGQGTFKGYLRDDFEDAWNRYLEPEKKEV